MSHVDGPLTWATGVGDSGDRGCWTRTKRRAGNGIIAQLTRSKTRARCNESWYPRKLANNYYTTSRSGYCPTWTGQEGRAAWARGRRETGGEREDWTEGVALRIMAALERSCEPDVPACQQQLCIIECLPHVNACLLLPSACRLSTPVPLLGPFLL